MERQIFIGDTGKRIEKNVLKQLDPVNHRVSALEDAWVYQLIKTATTTTVITGAGEVGFIQVLGGTDGNVTVYDNTAGSGTEIIPLVAVTVANRPNLIPKPIEVSLGLTIVTSAASYILVGYRTLPLV